jgi:RPA family protein
MAETNTPPNQQQKRQVAYKLMIKNIIESNYIKEEGWNPNYLELKNGKQISRVNIIGTIIDKQFDTNQNYQNLTIDDGTGNISLRSFEDNPILENLNIGESILVIGRPREFGNQRYVVIEIIKKIQEKGWIELRKKELNNTLKNSNNAIETTQPLENPPSQTKIEEEVITEDKDLISIIKELDNGGGVAMNDVIEKSKDVNAEKKINNMIKIGELFEIKPGKIKVLE